MSKPLQKNLLPCLRMRLFFICVVFLATTSLSAPNVRAQSLATLDGFLEGTVSLNNAVNTFEKLGVEAWASREIAPLVSRAADEKRESQLLEALSILARPDADVEKVLLRYAQSTDAGFANLAARGLGRIKSKRAIPLLVANLQSKNSVVRSGAAKALGQIGAKEATKPLLALALAEKDDIEKKAMFIVAAGKGGDTKQTKVFEQLLKDSSESVRLAAAQSLCSMGVKSGAVFAKKLLDSTEESERMLGVKLVDGIPLKLMKPILESTLKDASDAVRAKAAGQMARAGDATMRTYLVVESAKAEGSKQSVFEFEIETLHMTSEERSAILLKAGIK
jgi:HEAT repeat protein